MTQLSEENSQKTQETSEQKETIRVGIYMIGVFILKILSIGKKNRTAVNTSLFLHPSAKYPSHAFSHITVNEDELTKWSN